LAYALVCGPGSDQQDKLPAAPQPPVRL